MPGFKVKVLADSISPDKVRLATIAYQAPRVVLAELNTHRALSRNAESSRAIPFEKKLSQILSNPYIPDDLPDGELMGESKGMQASAPLSAKDKSWGQDEYRAASDAAVHHAKRMSEHSFHKQDVNRLLEPFAYTRGVVSSTELANFFALRCDWRAYPPFRFLARCVWVALSRSVPTPVNWGQWHLPFISDADRTEAATRANAMNAAKVSIPSGFAAWADCLLARWSAARCARVSYYEFGRREPNWEKDSETYDKLAGSFPIHASPLEHPAYCGSPGSLQRGFPLSNFRAPWVQLRKFVVGENIREFSPTPEEVEKWNVPESVFAGDPGSEW